MFFKKSPKQKAYQLRSKTREADRDFSFKVCVLCLCEVNTIFISQQTAMGRKKRYFGSWPNDPQVKSSSFTCFSKQYFIGTQPRPFIYICLRLLSLKKSKLSSGYRDYRVHKDENNYYLAFYTKSLSMPTPVLETEKPGPQQ